jgi:hypothetical protein
MLSRRGQVDRHHRHRHRTPRGDQAAPARSTPTNSVSFSKTRSRRSAVMTVGWRFRCDVRDSCSASEPFARRARALQNREANAGCIALDGNTRVPQPAPSLCSRSVADSRRPIQRPYRPLFSRPARAGPVLRDVTRRPEPRRRRGTACRDLGAASHAPAQRQLHERVRAVQQAQRPARECATQLVMSTTRPR